jgi:hypothetical protein
MGSFKNLLLQNHMANSNQIWHRSSIGGGDSSLFKRRQNPSPRGDNSERVNIHRKFFKIFFSRTSRPNSIKLNTNYPYVKGIQVCTNKGPGPLQRGDNHKNKKNGVGSFKNLLMKNYWAKFNQTWHKSSLGVGDSSFFKQRG